jgi:peroxiredoxin
MLRLPLTVLIAAWAWLSPLMAFAALQQGERAPTFKAPAALDGKPFEFDLTEALKKGPVVLYFYPKAFTHGCTIEAHAFAEATPRFSALGATVVGISHDDIETLKRFSTEACRSQFAVVSDPQANTIKAYDAASLLPGVASRISYVIGRDGKVAFTHEGSNPLQHVEETMKAVQRLTQPPR